MHPKLEELTKALNTDTYDAVRQALEAIVHDAEYGFYAYQWIDYNVVKQWRLKCWHDIRLQGGREVLGCRPNADKWHAFRGESFHDNDVTHVRISKKDWNDHD